jgi:conjugative transposon TraK protein
MAFPTLLNRESAFQQVKALAALFMVLCATLSGYAIYASQRTARLAQEHIYLLDQQGNLVGATARSAKENRPVEAEAHVKRFHELFYTLDPDPKAIESNVTQALFLADESAKRAYDNYKESGYYNNLIQANISQHITVDSVLVDPGTFYAKCFATEQIIRATNVTTRALVSECYLRDVSRSPNNPHGFIMERWRMIQNNDLRTEARL